MPMSRPAIDRHRTAIRRVELSRPMKLAMGHGLVSQESSILDYGCGRGDDVRMLRAMGYEASGWDPAHGGPQPDSPADIVNLGYVVNVIERPDERCAALRRAWELSRSLLVVSARLSFEREARFGREFADGHLSTRGTFQKFFEQVELRDWIEGTLETSAVAAAPGVFYVFQDETARQTFVASRFRRTLGVPRVRVHEQLFREYQHLFEPVLAFLGERGRFPDQSELPSLLELVTSVGGQKRIERIIERVVGTEQFEQVQIGRSRDLLVYLALARFGGRPKLSALAPAMQRDIKAFFTTYSRAAELADHLLFSAGNMELISEACQESEVGKLTPTALYVHQSALGELAPLLRVYEGCARVLIGDVDDVTIIKLHRMKPKISYLDYPSFEKDAHPALSRSIYVHLRSFLVDSVDYSRSENPFVLHRKEVFVAQSHPSREKFARLTRAEERLGLLDDTQSIGTRNGWMETVARAGVAISGHRVVRTADSPTPTTFDG
jgi:DNA phosphorothioation-associated putative methyltransferase